MNTKHTLARRAYLKTKEVNSSGGTSLTDEEDAELGSWDAAHPNPEPPFPTCIECHEIFDRTSNGQRFCPKCYEQMRERTTARPTGQTQPMNTHLRTVTLIPVTRPKGMVHVQLGPKADPTDCFKDRAEWLLDGLNARWSYSGYTLSPTRAEAFLKLYNAGWRATRRLMARSGPASFYPPSANVITGPFFTIKQALAQIDQ